MRFKFTKIIFVFLLFQIGIKPLIGQQTKFKFVNCEGYYYADVDLQYSWYGECKDGLADGYGMLSKDTTSSRYIKPINLYKTVVFDKGVQLPKDILVGQNRYVEKHFDLKEGVNLNNYAYFITFETSDKIYTVYRTAYFSGSHNPIKDLSVYDKASGSIRLYIWVTEIPDGVYVHHYFQVWNKVADSDWTKTTLENCGYPPEECEFTQSLRELFAKSMAANDPVPFYALASEICLNVVEVGFAQDNVYKKSLGLFYPEFIDSANKLNINEKMRDFFVERCDNAWKGVPFLRNAVEANFSRSKNEINLKKAGEFGLSIRYTFKRDVIGKRYVPVLTKSYTTTVEEFYINDQKVEITESGESESGGYSENRYGYIGIYQLANESKDYLIVPLTIRGEAKFSENTIVNKGFFFYNAGRGTEVMYKPFRVDKTFLLGPGELVKEQLETGEEIPPNFRIEFGDIQKVDPSWVARLDKALNGDLVALKETLNDEKTTPWKSELGKSFEAATLKLFSPMVILSIKPSDELSFDPDFESEVKAIITNKSAKTLIITVETSFRKTAKVTVQPAQSETLTFLVKGLFKESLKISLRKVEPVN